MKKPDRSEEASMENTEKCQQIALGLAAEFYERTKDMTVSQRAACSTRLAGTLRFLVLEEMWHGMPGVTPEAREQGRVLWDFQVGRAYRQSMDETVEEREG